jgi:N-acyl-D-amino-acid deacylase
LIAVGILTFIAYCMTEKLGLGQVDNRPSIPGPRALAGDAAPGLERLDRVMLDTLRDSGIPGASLAIAKDGKLLLARGYGLGNIAAHEPVQPQSLFNLASCSKPFTAVAVLKLVDEGKLRLDDRVFSLLPQLLPEGQPVDPRIYRITVRELLHHSSGFARDEGVKRAPSLEAAVRAAAYRPLSYSPGTEIKYSNFGFLLLRVVVKQAASEDYERYIKQEVLQPLGIHDMRLDVEHGYVPGEVRRYSATRQVVPGGHGDVHGEGCWLASTVDVVRFLCSLDGSRGRHILSPRSLQEMVSAPAPPVKPHADGSHNGLGWDVVRPMPDGVLYQKNGGVAGISTFMEHLPNGVDWAVAFNGSGKVEESDPSGHEHPASPYKPIKDAIQARTHWPTAVDLFGKYP